MSIGNAIALTAVVVALLLYLLQEASSRRRDMTAARAVLLGVKYGMVEGWGSWFFSREWAGGELDRRARDDEDVPLVVELRDGGPGVMVRR